MNQKEQEMKRSAWTAHLAGGVFDGVLLEQVGNAGRLQALLHDALELVTLVRLEHDAAAAQARCDARQQTLGQIERVGDADHRQPRPRPRRPLAEIVQHLHMWHLFSRAALIFLAPWMICPCANQQQPAPHTDCLALHMWRGSSNLTGQWVQRGVMLPALSMASHC